MVLWGEQPPCLQSWVAGTGGSSHTNARGTSRFLSRAGSPFTLQQQQFLPQLQLHVLSDLVLSKAGQEPDTDNNMVSTRSGNKNQTNTHAQNQNQDYASTQPTAERTEEKHPSTATIYGGHVPDAADPTPHEQMRTKPKLGLILVGKERRRKSAT